MAKIMLHDEAARAALGRGVAKLAKAVRGTLGPKGMNAIMDRPIGTPIVSRDGVAIASEIELECPFENMGAQVLREVSKQTNDVAGDGTTTATVLADVLVQDGLKSLAEGANPVELVEVPFERNSLPGLLYKAQGAGPRPCLIFFSGFDVSKEYLFLFGIGPELSARGISVLFIDHPGVGEALRLRGLHAFPETERATTPCVDYLQTRRDIDGDRIGVIGVVVP